jgi:hypothetical protein
MIKRAVLVSILLLHGPTGREIRLNTSMVTSLHAPQGPNKSLSEEVRCLINTADGKFISVVESCADIARLIEEPR